MSGTFYVQAHPQRVCVSAAYMSLREHWDLKLVVEMMRRVRVAKVMGVVVEQWKEAGKEEAGRAMAVVVMEVEGRVEQGKFEAPCRHTEI